jgi:dsDNA-specific endonuclease/ATPase MutS2
MTEQPVPMDIDGILDLHMFPPKVVRDLVPDYLGECLAAGILDVRIIHGKGIGVLREIVVKILQEHPQVEHFAHPNDGSGWGATVVRLRPPGEVG